MATEKKYTLQDRIAVTGTGKVSGFPAGETRKVHPRLANVLIKAGKAKRADGRKSDEKE